MDKPFVIEAGAHTDKGMRRQVNEDRLATPPAGLAPELLARKGHLYIVADGIGGHRAGDRASEVAVATVMQQYYADPSPNVRESLVRAIQAANAEIHRLAQDPAYAKMGTTLVAAVVRGGDLTVAHVGDSRAYLSRRDGIQALTQDHTWVAEQVRNGLLTPEQARQHLQRHVLVRSLGRDPQVDVDVGRTALAPGDRVLLCSDGLSELAEAAELQTVVQSHPPQEAVRRLVDLANQRGGPDNSTAVVVRPAVASPPLTLPRSAEDMQGVLGDLYARFLVLPADRRLLVGAAAVAFLLVGFICALAIMIPRRPSVPSVNIAPVSYEVVEGDTPEAIAAYFQTTTETLPVDIAVGQKLPITPGEYGIFFSGQVTSVQLDADTVMLEVANQSERYSVRGDLHDDLRAEGVTVTSDAAPKKGDTVAVFGFPREGDDVDAAVIDVWQEDAWDTWYYQHNASPVWVYTGFHKYLIRPPAFKPELEGKQVLVRGMWSLAQDAATTQGAARFSREPQDLFVWEKESYTSEVPPTERQTLAARVEPTWTPSPEYTPATDGKSPPVVLEEPTMGPSPAETATPAPPGALFGEIMASPSLAVREGPTMNNPVLYRLEEGTEVQVSCWEKGDVIGGEDQWYHVRFGESPDGYASAYYISLKNAQPGDVSPCGE
jgi:serine/threonine protein phosphatase PrpC